MTVKQAKLLLFIKKYIKINKIPPTLFEMRDFLQVKALSTVHQHLEALIFRGYIYQDKKGSPRCYYPDSNPPTSYEEVKRYRERKYYGAF